MQSIEIKVKNAIFSKGRGWCFTAKDFWDVGSPESINTSLFRLEEKGLIRRIAHGIFDYPKIHQIGYLPPEYTSVANAIARKFNIKIQPSGAFASNLLGLTNQVTAKVVFLTDGASKKILIGKTEFIFKKTTPKIMQMAGKISGLVVAALKYLGKEKITEREIAILKAHLRPEDKKQLFLDAKLAPAWITKIIRNKILEEIHG